MVCGSTLDDQDSYCGNCGEPVVSDASVACVSEPLHDEARYRFFSNYPGGKEGEFNETTLLWNSLLREGETKANAGSEDDIPTKVARHISYVLRRLKTGEAFQLHIPCVVGRGRAADCRIRGNVTISRTHLQFFFQNGKVVARELSPKNKTYLNGRAFDDICPQHMNAGDVIRLGDEDFVFEVDSHA